MGKGYDPQPIIEGRPGGSDEGLNGPGEGGRRLLRYENENFGCVRARACAFKGPYPTKAEARQSCSLVRVFQAAVWFA